MNQAEVLALVVRSKARGASIATVEPGSPNSSTSEGSQKDAARRAAGVRILCIDEVSRVAVDASTAALLHRDHGVANLKGTWQREFGSYAQINARARAKVYGTALPGSPDGYR